MPGPSTSNRALAIGTDFALEDRPERHTGPVVPGHQVMHLRENEDTRLQTLAGRIAAAGRLACERLDHRQRVLHLVVQLVQHDCLLILQGTTTRDLFLQLGFVALEGSRHHVELAPQTPELVLPSQARACGEITGLPGGHRPQQAPNGRSRSNLAARGQLIGVRWWTLIARSIALCRRSASASILSVGPT